MQVTVEEQSSCNVKLNIEVNEETVAKTIDDVYREYNKHVQVPGFRKGKAPRHLLERYVSEEDVRKRSIERMVSPAYFEAVKQEDIHPYSEPDIDIVQYEPGKAFIFKADIPLPPDVKLGEYRGIEATRPEVQITDEDVDKQIEQIRESRAITEKVEDRGIQENDITIAEISTTVEGEEKVEPKRSLIRTGDNVPGFDENIMGLKSGERKLFVLDVAEDYKDGAMAGKKVEFDVAVESIRERKLPDLDDVFAKSLGEYENLDQLKEDIKKGMTESAEENAEKAVENKIIEEIVSRSEICFPNIMVDHDVYHDIQGINERLSKQGITLEQYLSMTNKTMDDFINGLKEEAAKRIKVGLVLGEVADKENLDVPEEEIDAEIDRITESSNTTREAVEAFLESRGGRSGLKNTMTTRKIIDFLKSVSVIK